MPFAKRMGKVADKLLTKYDERAVKAILITPGEKVFNPAIGDYEFSASTEQELIGVATSYNQNLIASSTVHRDDIKFIATRAIKPTQADSVRMDNVTYGIESVTPKAYTGDDLTICYEIQLRK